MSAVRYVRVTATAALVVFLFVQSQRFTLAREGETVPGLAPALGAISVLLLVRALVTEKVRPPGLSFEKDVLWGLALGGIGATLALFL